MRLKLALLLALLTFAFAAPAAAAPLLSDNLSTSPLPSGTVFPYQLDGIPYYVYVPSTAARSSPLTPLLVIHGFGEDARARATSMIRVADWYGWMLIVPDLPSGDWKDLQVIKADARRNLPWLHRLIHNLPSIAGAPVRSQVLLYGFSLGAQTGHRFALAYPEDVKAAAVMSAGTYTLPTLWSATGEEPLSFPMGSFDLDSYAQQPLNPEGLRHTHFWVGVGEADAAPADVPREFDRYVGDCRKDRAANFVRSLWDQSIPTEFQTFPGQGHWETPASVDAATGFLFRVTQAEPWSP